MPSCAFLPGVTLPALPAVEQGCVLIANPSLFATSQTYFRQAVIFIYSHSDSAGSAGIILNRATEKRFRDVTNNEQFKDFSDSLLWLGGDVGRSTMHVMHPEHIGGTRVVPGVAMGGFDAARLALLQGRMERDECRFFTRYSGWGPGQLADEVAQGVGPDTVFRAGDNVIVTGRHDSEPALHESLIGPLPGA